MNVVDAILQSVDLLSVATEAELRNVGKDRWRGRCVIHGGDSLQSLEVRRHRNGHLIFQCHVCHERGSVIDYVAKTENLSIRQSIERLREKKWTDPPLDLTLDRHHARYLRTLGKFALCCDKPGCLSVPREVGDDLEAAVVCADGSPWEVAPDGVGAICPDCLSGQNRMYLTRLQRLKRAIEYRLLFEELESEELQ